MLHKVQLLPWVIRYLGTIRFQRLKKYTETNIGALNRRIDVWHIWKVHHRVIMHVIMEADVKDLEVLVIDSVRTANKEEVPH